MSNNVSETVFLVGETEYDVVRKGIGQARQIAKMSSILGKYGAPIYKKLSDSSSGSVFSADGVAVITSVLSSLDEEALMSVFMMVFDCPRKVAEEHFDIDLMIDGLIALYNYQPAVQKLVSRFFSSTSSSEPEPENSI